LSSDRHVVPLRQLLFADRHVVPLTQLSAARYVALLKQLSISGQHLFQWDDMSISG
jgi:hypothetical protein